MPTIVSFADLTSMLNLTKPALADYPDLSLIANSVHAALESYAGRRLDSISKVTEVGFLIGNQVSLNLKNLPLTSITSVVLAGVAITAYEINNYGLTLSTAASGSWTVVAKGGFKTIPEEIYRAELSQIVYEYQNKNNLAAKSFTNDGGGVTLPGFVLLDHVKELLSPFRHIDKLGY